jgi:RNA polymerase sigma factor (sigma-70 family)
MVSIKALKMQKKNADDLSALVARAQENPAAFGRLYDLYIQPVFRYLYRQVDSLQDAEDLTSQTFVAAYEALPRFQGQNHFAAWLFGIARHKLMDYYRRKSAQPQLQISETLSKEEDLLGQIILNEDLSHLRSLIQDLTREEQDLIYLRYLVGLSYAEIAEVVGKSMEAVKKSVYRLLARIKSQME